ncbi:MAG: hypothetical protein MUE73_00395 [Planctomycetes bacterium]|jgi:hypothetical protein|nr:hypothetical protein [Planctomycetota bacterium]
MAKERFRRRKIIVDRRFQFGISLRVVLFLAGYLLLFYLMAVFAPFILMVLSGGTEEAMITATRQVTLFVEQLLLPLGLTFACLGLHCILLTHRIAGPVYRLRRTMDSAAAGDWSTDVRLRDGDYLKALADGWNLMVTPLRRDLEAVRGDLRETLAEVLAEGSGVTDRRRLAGKLERALGVLDAYRTRPESEDDAVMGDGEARVEERAALEV